MRAVFVLTLILTLAVAPASAGAPATVTVVVSQPPQRVVLKLVPDYAIVLAFDCPISTVGIGDDSLLATAVRETDLIMKALRPSGRTNLLVWVGDVRTVWEIVVNRRERTADVVQVVTQPPSPSPSPPVPPADESPYGHLGRIISSCLIPEASQRQRCLCFSYGGHSLFQWDRASASSAAQTEDSRPKCPLPAVGTEVI